MDWQAVLYDPIYEALGVDAVLDMGTDGEFTLRVIDKTSGVEVGESVEVSTILPAADVRMRELADNAISREDVNDKTITINGKVWTIKNHGLRPGPGGESDGELRMMLSES